MRDLRFSRQWRFKSRSSGLWRRVVLWYDTNAAFCHNTARRHNPEDLDLSIVTRLWVWRPDFDPGKGTERIFFSSPLRPDQFLGLTQPPAQWVPKALFPRMKRLGSETRHSPPTTHLRLVPYVYMSRYFIKQGFRGVYLVERKDKIYL
jgi:hypothetical protein